MSTGRNDASRVFVSYSHDSPMHRDRVRGLVERLRTDGFVVFFDGDVGESTAPPGGWPQWCEDRLEEADLVLAVCTQTYRRRFEKREPPGIGRGATWEGDRLLDELYDAGGRNHRIVPVVLETAATDAIPYRLRQTRRFHLETDYDALVGLLGDESRRAAWRSGKPQPLPRWVDGLVSSGIVPLPAEPPPSQLLHARHGVVPFSREVCQREMEALREWCRGDGVRVRLFHGPGGAGKTRLFQWWCSELREEGWLAGFLLAGLGAEDLASVLDDARSVLLVVDYAESKSLSELLAAVLSRQSAGRSTPLRIALVARNAGDWWLALVGRSPEMATLLRWHPPMLVSKLPPAQDVRQGLFEAAHQAFRRRLGIDAEPPVVDLSDDRFGRVLYVHAAALDHLRRLADPTGAEVDAPLGTIGAVLEHEQRFWTSRWSVPEDSDQDGRRFSFAARRAVAAVTIRGGMPDVTATRRLLARIEAPRHPDDTSSHESFVMLLRDLYPGRNEGDGMDADGESGFCSPLEPDLLGEALVAEVLRNESIDFFEEVFVDASPSSWRQGFMVFARVFPESPSATERVVEHLLSRDLESRALTAVDAIVSVSVQRVFDPIAEVITRRVSQGASPSLAASIDAMLPLESLALAELGLWASRARLAAASSDEQPVLLDRMASRCRLLGRSEEALELSARAVATCRALARDRPDEMLVTLAMCLHHAGVHLHLLGRNDEALGHIEEAVGLHRRLVEDSDVHYPNLALALDNMANVLKARGDDPEALEATREAVWVLEQLVEVVPERFLGSLARCYGNMGNRLRAMGRHEEALVFADKAVEVLRQLVKERPDAFLPDLAIALLNLGNRLFVLGRFEEACSRTLEAVELRRELVRHRPEVYLRDLAESLLNASTQLFRSGRGPQALTAAAESLRLWCGLLEEHGESEAGGFTLGVGSYAQLLLALEHGPEDEALFGYSLEVFERVCGRSLESTLRPPDE